MASESGQGALIDITVKTLDGQNRTFNVLESLSVRQFKEEISSNIEVPADNQRLIFQGRVMQDEKGLKDYDIHGKVIHLVQRAPPTTATASDASNPSSATAPTPAAGRTHVPLDGSLFDVQIHLGRLQNTPNTREARARLRQADLNLRLVDDILNQLEQRLGSRLGDSATQGASEFSRSTSSTVDSVTTATADNQSEGNMDSSTPPPADRMSQTESRNQAGQQPRHSSESAGGSVGDQRPHLMATDLADFLDQVLSTNERVTSHIRLYRDILRNEVTYPALSREAQDAQEIVSRATEIFHALGHMLHSLSDVAVDMGADMPRQVVAAPPVPFPIPGTASMAIPIHMNVRARQNSNGHRPRQNQPASSAATTTGSTSTVPAATTTPSSSSASGRNAAAASTTATISAVGGTNTVNVGPSIGSFQMPPVSLNLPSNVTTTGDPTVMVEVFPAGVTVHDIRAVVTQGGIEDDSDSSSDSVDNIGGNRTNITIMSSTSTGHPVPLPASTATSATVTAISSEPPPPPASTPQTTGTGTFPTTTSSSSAFIFGPTASVSFRDMPNVGFGQIPNVPGLPPGMLQNILGSVLNSHGLISLPARGDTPQNPRSTDASTGIQTNAAATSTVSTAATNSTSSATSTASSASRIAFPMALNWSNLGSQSIIRGAGADSNTGASVRSTSTPRPQFHFHWDSPSQRRPHPVPTRHQAPASLRPGLGSRGYVDPYLPCSSSHYASQTALAAFSAIQALSRGQQPQQQVPNLSAMVSGMVGEIIEQAGQAAMNSGSRTSSSTASTSTSANTSSAPSTATTGIGAERPLPLNPMEMFSHLLRGSGSSGQTGSAPIGATIFDNIMQPRSAPATTTTTPTGRGPAAAPPTWTLADLFTHVRHASEGSVGDVTVIISLLEAVAPHMGLTDLFSLFMGNTRVLGQVRGPLREFVRRQVTHYGSVDQVVEAALNDMYPEIQYLQTLVEVRDGMDLAQSLRNCLRVHLTTIFTAINSDSAGPQGDFGSHMYSLWMKMLADSIGLCIYCIRDGQTGFSNMVQSYMPRMTQGMSPAITVWMTTSLQDIFESFHQNHPVTESDIKCYIVKRQPERPAASSGREQNHPGPEALLTNVSGGLTTENVEVNSSNLSGTSSSSPMDTTESSQLPLAEDWIPVISRDIVRQKDQRPQPPLSDAYLQGLPAKRRRMMSLEHAGEVGNMPLYLPASLTRAARAADAEPISSEENMAQEAADNLDLQTELEREVTRVLASRITSDQDYSSEQFPNAKEYFQKSSRR